MTRRPIKVAVYLKDALGASNQMPARFTEALGRELKNGAPGKSSLPCGLGGA